MFHISSLKDLSWLLLKSAVVGILNAWLFAMVIGPQVPKELDAYANTVAVTVGVIWLFFTTSIWVITDGESKKVAEAIEDHEEAKFLREASKRVSPGIWLIYAVATIATLATFDLFHVGSGVEIFASALNFIISFLVIVGAIVVLDSDDSLKGVVVVSNASEASEEWLTKLRTRMKTKS